MKSIFRTTMLLVALGGLVMACGEDSATAPSRMTLPPDPALGSISPTGVAVGSPDLTVVLIGSGFRSGIAGSRAVWRSRGSDTFLNTTFVSSSELRAVVPAALLRDQVAAQLYVATGDVMGDIPLLNSAAVAFTIRPAPPKAQRLDSISPNGTSAGSADLTFTLTGSGFKSGSKTGSRAAWRTTAGTTYLSTTFVSGSELTAVVPAQLLQDTVAAQVFVATGDVMGDVPLAESNAVAFTVTPPPVQRRPSVLPKVFDVGTLPLGHSGTFSRTLLATDPICLYWWDYRGFDVAEPCHGYRVTIPAAGHLRAILTWSPDGWMSLSTEDRAGLPTADGPPMRFSREVQAGQTVVVTVGNHGGNARVDYNLQLQLVP